MKKIIITFTILLVAIKVMAQTVETTVSGNIRDIKNTPVESATISLRTAKDSSIFKITASNKAGKFTFTDMPYGNYFITVSAVSFEAVNSGVQGGTWAAGPVFLVLFTFS